MNQLRKTICYVIVKNDTQNQRYDQIKQFYDSCTVSDGSFEDLILVRTPSLL